MADIYLDRDGDRFKVRVMTGMYGDKTRHFDTYEEANTFAFSKMGKRSGCIIDSTKMTPEQLAAKHARDARTAEFLAAFDAEKAKVTA
jgi:hypothetical protein